MRIQRALIKYPNKLCVNSFILRNGFQFATININGLIECEEKITPCVFLSWLLKRNVISSGFEKQMGQLVILKSGKQLDVSSLWNSGEWPSRGVAILFNIHQGVVIKEDTTDNDGRVLSCEIKKIQIN